MIANYYVWQISKNINEVLINEGYKQSIRLQKLKQINHYPNEKTNLSNRINSPHHR